MIKKLEIIIFKNKKQKQKRITHGLDIFCSEEAVVINLLPAKRLTGTTLKNSPLPSTATTKKAPLFPRRLPYFLSKLIQLNLIHLFTHGLRIKLFPVIKSETLRARLYGQKSENVSKSENVFSLLSLLGGSRGKHKMCVGVWVLKGVYKARCGQWIYRAGHFETSTRMEFATDYIDVSFIFFSVLSFKRIIWTIVLKVAISFQRHKTPF